MRISRMVASLGPAALLACATVRPPAANDVPLAAQAEAPGLLFELLYTSADAPEVARIRAGLLSAGPRLLRWAASGRASGSTGPRVAETVLIGPSRGEGVYTGMRMGELFGLRWTDVDLETARIHVRRSYRTTPKSGKARTIPLSPHLAPILRAWKADCRRTDENLVFPAPLAGPRGKLDREQAAELRRRGQTESPAALARAFSVSWTAAKKIVVGRSWKERQPGDSEMRDKDGDLGFHAALKAAGCHRVRFHDLRHTYASHFMMAGGSILTLQKLLGHHDVKVTMKYAHLAQDFMAAEAARVSFQSKSTLNSGVVALAGVASRPKGRSPSP